MSLESKIDDLIAAVEANTKALLGGGGKATNGKADESKDAKEEAAPRERTSRRGAREETKASDGPTEAELKDAVAKFLDQPSTKEGDDEYERRLNKAIDPVFEKAGVKELPDLPEKYWPDIIANIADYEKAAKEKSETGSGRRSRR